MSQKKRDCKMDQEFLINLPSEIIIDILSRLPVRTIMSCKCVCKTWRDLVETHEFAKSHRSKSVPGLAIHQPNRQSEWYQIFEFGDGVDLEHHELHYNLLTTFNFPRFALIRGSVDGLLLFLNPSGKPDVYICNPITRDYIELHCPQRQGFVFSYPKVVTYGFGASKMTYQHKVVRILHDCILDQGTNQLRRVPESECQVIVYTLGTGSWRSVAPGALLRYTCDSIGVFLNGNLHWLVFDLEGCPSISCFDLETELFSTFSSPPLPGLTEYDPVVSTLGDCLCLCDNASNDKIVIWLMKEYGVETSWTKEFLISKIPHIGVDPFEVVYPIKLFEDGDILMACQKYFLFYYSSKTKTTQRTDIFEPYPRISVGSILHTASFFSLKSFGMENASSF